MDKGRGAGGDACALGFAEEPPAKEADQSTYNGDHSHRDPRDGAGGEVDAPGGDTCLALQLVAGAACRALEGACPSSGVCALRAPWNARHGWS